MSWSIFSKMLVLRVSTAARSFDNFFAAGTKFTVMYPIGYWKLIRKPLIWAVAENLSINRSRDTAVWIFLKILGYEKKFHIFAFFILKMACYPKSNDFIGSKWHIFDSIRGLWIILCRKIAKIRRKIKIFGKIFLNDLAAARRL